MNPKLFLPALALISTLNAQLSTGLASTTIDPANKYAWGANIGWMDWRGDTNNGAVIGEYVCSGYLYAANVGWICLGNGSPTNGIQYQNASSNDFGVNQDGLGNLHGFAWGANIGWIAFETNGAPKVDLLTGKLSGYAWSANCGWISLSNSAAYVQTDAIQQGALAPDGLPIAWLLQNFGTTNVNAKADPTGKGMTIGQDYLAGTDPNNPNSVFKITYENRGSSPNYTILDWNAVSIRYYAIQTNSSLNKGVWADFAALPIAGWNNAGFSDFDSTNEFYRIRAYRPLMP